MPDLSVVVCTHERQADLRECLHGLAELEADFEVVVVDSGPTVPCLPVVECYRDRIKQLRYVCVEQAGLSRARNAGVEVSQAAIVAFIDDDAVPQYGWERALLAGFALHPEAGCVGGACVARFAGPRPRWLSDRLLQMASITRWDDQPREPRSTAEWPFGANVAFRRAALRDAGPFSVQLGRDGTDSLMSGEDSDMIARVLAAGWRVRLEPSARVWHTVPANRLTTVFYWRRFWWGGVSRARAASWRTTIRLTIAAPIRLGLWMVTRDRIYLYRLAETAGYIATLLRPRKPLHP